MPRFKIFEQVKESSPADFIWWSNSKTSRTTDTYRHKVHQSSRCFSRPVKWTCACHDESCKAWLGLELTVLVKVPELPSFKIMAQRGHAHVQLELAGLSDKWLFSVGWSRQSGIVSDPRLQVENLVLPTADCLGCPYANWKSSLHPLERNRTKDRFVLWSLQHAKTYNKHTRIIKYSCLDVASIAVLWLRVDLQTNWGVYPCGFVPTNDQAERGSITHTH